MVGAAERGNGHQQIGSHGARASEGRRQPSRGHKSGQDIVLANELGSALVEMGRIKRILNGASLEGAYGFERLRAISLLDPIGHLLVLRLSGSE